VDAGPFGKSDWELFDLSQDPGETNDLSREHPDRTDSMIALWEQYKAENGVLDISYDVSAAAE
jgi:arylsulfatase A-like enzyme